LVNLLEHRIRLIANRFECGNHRLVRRVHKSSSICWGLPPNRCHSRAQRRRRYVLMFT
jgi:hypothetical protein